MSNYLVMTTLAVLAAACSSTTGQQMSADLPQPLQVSSAATGQHAATLITAPINGPASSGATPLAKPRQWRPYRDFSFNQWSTMIRPTELQKSAAIAAYALLNPAAHFRVIGGWGDQDEGLGQQRLQVVRDSLIDAGVPSSRIEIGTVSSDGPSAEKSVLVQISDP